MPYISPDQLALRRQVIDICWEYLLQNFHKFSQGNKLKVSLAITLKSLPQELVGAGEEGEFVIKVEGDKDENDHLQIARFPIPSIQ